MCNCNGLIMLAVMHGYPKQNFLGGFKKVKARLIRNSTNCIVTSNQNLLLSGKALKLNDDIVYPQYYYDCVTWPPLYRGLLIHDIRLRSAFVFMNP